MSWSDYFPVFSDASSSIIDDQDIPEWILHVCEVSRVFGSCHQKHIVSTSATWAAVAASADAMLSPEAALRILTDGQDGPLSRVEKWLLTLGRTIRLLLQRKDAVGFRVYLDPELELWAQPIADAGAEAVVMRRSGGLPPVPGLWRLTALEREGLVTVLAPGRLEEAARCVYLTEIMQAAGLEFWRLPGYGIARTRDYSDYRPITNSILGGTGGVPVRRLLGSIESGRIQPVHRTSTGTTRVLGGASWPQAGYDEWFLMTALYPMAAQHGLLTLLEGQKLFPPLLAMDIEYATWANDRATVIAPEMGMDWRVTCADGNRDAEEACVSLLRVENCPVLETAGLTSSHPLPPHAWRDEVMLGIKINPRVVSHFNPATIRWKGHRWLAYRTECQPMWKWGRVSLARTSEDFRIIEGSNQLLNLPTSFGEWCAEDPRLFVHQDRLYLYYTDHWTGGIAEILETGEVGSAKLFPEEPLEGRPIPTRHDKNWGFFEASGQLYAVYWTRPHIVREIDLLKGRFGREWRTGWTHSGCPAQDLHGGSCPVLHDGLMWRTVHHHECPETAGNGRRYSLWLMAFDASPPFSPRWFCSRPLLQGQRMPESALEGWRDWLVVFCSSLERCAGGWRFLFGHNDRRMRWGEISDAAIEPWLSEVVPEFGSPVNPIVANISKHSAF